jgi:hypothetical protein
MAACTLSRLPVLANTCGDLGVVQAGADQGEHVVSRAVSW